MEQYKIEVVSVLDLDFPPLLKEIKPVPFALYYRGDIGCLKKPCVGVVGTRHPDTEGLKTVDDLIKSIRDTITSDLVNKFDSLETEIGDLVT